MQGNDFVTSQMYTHGVSCFSCHDVHGTDNNADLVKPAMFCAWSATARTPPTVPRSHHRGAQHHKAGSAGNECVSCHMPKIEQTIATSLSAPIFVLAPAATETLKVPNACAACHANEPTGLCSQALKSWPNIYHGGPLGRVRMNNTDVFLSVLCRIMNSHTLRVDEALFR